MVNETAVGSRPRLAPLLVLGVGVGLEIVYISLFSPFVTTDGAAHAGAAAALVDTVRGFELDGRFLEWNPWPAPNLLGNLLLAALLPVFGVEWALRLILAGYVVALPVATLYAVRAMRPGSAWLACFALPVTFSFCVLWGFFSFAYSIIAFLLTAGFLLRSPLRLARTRTAALAGLLLLTFFSHLVAFGLACLFVVLVFAMRALFHGELRGNIAGHGLAALAPSVALAVAYVASSGSAEGASWSHSPLRKLAETMTATWGIVTYDRLENLFCLALAAALAFLVLAAAARVRPWSVRSPDTIAAGVFTIIAVLLTAVAPDAVGSGGAFISQRLALFPLFGVLIWLAGQDLRRSYVIAAAMVAIVAATGVAIVRYDELNQAERIGRDLTAIGWCAEDGRTIVQGNLARVPFGSLGRIDLFTNDASRLAAASDGLDLMAVDLRVPQWLQRFRPETSVAEHLTPPTAHGIDFPPPLDFAAYERSTGLQIDHVLLFGRPAMAQTTRASSSWQRFDRSLREHYRLEGRSPERWWELWVLRGLDCQ